jgi:hypothetical protein
MVDSDLYIVAVELPDDSWKSQRTLSRGNPDLYDVIVYLSRYVDEYERQELDAFGIIREEDDRMCALIRDTTLEQIRDRLDEHNEVLKSAVEKARPTRELAVVEDKRLRELLSKLNKDLADDHRRRMTS